MIRYLGHLLLDRLLPPAGDVTITHTQHAKLVADAECSMAMIVSAESHGVSRGRREEREAVVKWLRPGGVCVWCRRERGHGEGCRIGAIETEEHVREVSDDE